jgi:murein L,D-transpeptidase YcbB/YkuD
MRRLFPGFGYHRGTLLLPQRTGAGHGSVIIRDGQLLHWLVAGALVGLTACSDRSPSPDSVVAPAAQTFPLGSRAAIRARIDDGEALGVRLPAAEQDELRRLYAPTGFAPLWVDASGRLGPGAREALSILGGSSDDGLDPASYHIGVLDRSVDALAGPAPPMSEAAGFDVVLSASMLRYFRHLHLGRVDPHSIGYRLKVPRESHDFVALLRSAVDRRQLTETALTLAPPLIQYRTLRVELSRYRSLAADPGVTPVPPAPRSVHPGDSYAGLSSLARLLASVGDLPADQPAASTSARYEGRLVDAVKRFQARHGLEPDGVIGTRTRTALAVPLAWRVRQIELALERLRWLPDLGERRLVALNIPMFRLWTWNTIPPDDTPAFGMSVIVGRALDTETPVFEHEMRELIFRPYWNVPPSILREEILPIIKRDPAYLERENMEIVRGPGDDAVAVDATRENIAGLERGALRLRQRPGPRNALGLVKFVFPNEENVYMHGTPAQALFERSRRDFSHGCVRVEDPVRLAEWALAEQPDWNRDRIIAAMDGPESFHVRLAQPIQVILFYTTAAVMPEDGTLHFAEDIYRHDARLDRALRAR